MKFLSIAATSALFSVLCVSSNGLSLKNKLSNFANAKANEENYTMEELNKTKEECWQRALDHLEHLMRVTEN